MTQAWPGNRRACHSVRMVTRRNLTDARWDYLWDWMIRVQGMPEMGERSA